MGAEPPEKEDASSSPSRCLFSVTDMYGPSNNLHITIKVMIQLLCLDRAVRVHDE